MAKILVVDDSETVRTQLRQALERENFQIVEACDGVDGLEALRNNRDIQLIICDLNMPRMDGLTMCGKLQTSPDLPKLPIFVLTTEAGTELKAEGKKLGVRGWIIKPFCAEKLTGAIKQVLKL